MVPPVKVASNLQRLMGVKVLAAPGGHALPLEAHMPAIRSRRPAVLGAVAGLLLPAAALFATAPAATAATAATSMPRCSTAVLSLSHTRHDVGAGQSYERLVLRNTGRRTCHLRGFPGVSYVVAAGRQVSAPASFTDQPRVTVLLAPGRSAYAVLHAVNIVDAVPDCTHLTQALGLRVYPPGSRNAMYVIDPHPACTGTRVHLLDVGPVRAGS